MFLTLFSLLLLLLLLVLLLFFFFFFFLLLLLCCFFNYLFESISPQAEIERKRKLNAALRESTAAIGLTAAAGGIGGCTGSGSGSIGGGGGGGSGGGMAHPTSSISGIKSK